ncbi:MAG: tetratricopeptide repeat protein [Leptospirillum sp.]|jgi:tetratricopeptide (TPR) repeat protein
MKKLLSGLLSIFFLSTVPLPLLAIPLAVPSDPVELQKKLPKMAALIMKGKASLALPELKKLDRRYPDHASVHFLTGIAYGKLGMNEEAVHEEKQALSNNPQYVPARISLGIAEGNTGHFKQEIREERIVLATDLKNESAWEATGWAYASLGKWSLAREAEEQAVRLNPFDDQAHMVLGISLAHLGFYQEALMEELKAKKLNPKDGGTLRAITWIKTLIAPENPQKHEKDAQTINPLLAPDQGDIPQGAPGIIPQSGGINSGNSGNLRAPARP